MRAADSYESHAVGAASERPHVHEYTTWYEVLKMRVTVGIRSWIILWLRYLCPGEATTATPIPYALSDALAALNSGEVGARAAS
jgi:hypothetical protein